MEESKTNTLISHARPSVSKNKKSYYRIKLSNGVEGMWFKPTMKVFPGMKVRLMSRQDPFVNIRPLMEIKNEINYS